MLFGARDEGREPPEPGWIVVLGVVSREAGPAAGSART